MDLFCRLPRLGQTYRYATVSRAHVKQTHTRPSPSAHHHQCALFSSLPISTRGEHEIYTGADSFTSTTEIDPDPDPDPDQLVLQVRDFAREASVFALQHKHDVYPHELVSTMRTLGLFGLAIPRAYGGGGATRDTICRTTVELSSGWLSLSALVGSHNRVCNYLVQFGSEEQKESYLPRLAAGDMIACHANQERNGKTMLEKETLVQRVPVWGNAKKTFSTSASDDEPADAFSATGTKDWVTNACHADLFAVSARFANGSSPATNTSSVLLLEKGHLGLSVGNDHARMGVQGISLAPVYLQDCKLSPNHFIGGPTQDGRPMVDGSKIGTYIAYSARGYGASRALLEKGSDIIATRERNLRSGSLTDNAVVKNRIAIYHTKLKALEALYHRTLQNINANTASEEEVGTCKVFVTETAQEIARGIMQLLGGAGYTEEHGVSRMVRDIHSLTIIGNTTDAILESVGSKLVQNASARTKHSQNLTLRHLHALDSLGIEQQFYEQATLNETMKILPSSEYRGVKFSILDLASDNPTKTFKDMLACVVFAHALQRNIKAFCAQSSGNTLKSFLKYARHTGISVILFYPKSNAYKIVSEDVPPNVTLVEVNAAEPEVKRILTEFSDLTGLPVLPKVEQQYEANKIRAYFLHEYYQEHGERFDWHIQAISSAYGPLGFYKGVDEIIANTDSSFRAPKMLGVQQEAVCPFVEHCGTAPDERDQNAPLIEPTLFRTTPTPNLITDMKDVLHRYGGHMKVLLNDDFARLSPLSIKVLSQTYGISTGFVQDEVTNQVRIMEASGVISLCAFFEEVERGNICPGEHALVAITGGPGKVPSSRFSPAHVIDGNVQTEKLVKIAVSALAS